VSRLCDVVFSFIAMVILFPLLLPIMVGLKLTGEHFIFYLQPRIGKGGRVFNVVKFATMLKNSPNLPGGFITQANDPRILPMGRFLRKSKINELPQLLNIFLGQMSFVGPRPHVEEHISMYPEATRTAILRLRPGLTGVGSLVFRGEEEILNHAGADRKSFYSSVIAPYKGNLELWYLEHRNLGLYFALIFWTAWTVVRPRSRKFRRAFRDLPAPPDSLRDLL
jgi:lipopolysaccharide/colanic/teichoic acid biosynthesis glycosyltransferase